MDYSKIYEPFSISQKDAMEILGGISLYQLNKNNLPTIKIKNRIFYDYIDLMFWLKPSSRGLPVSLFRSLEHPYSKIKKMFNVD